MRFRLLSYMCAMLLLAGVLGANLTPRATPGRIVFYDYYVATWDAWAQEYGWPIRCVTLDAGRRWQMPAPPPFDLPFLALDILIGLAIPIAGLLACEFVLRRWARSKKPTPEHPA